MADIIASVHAIDRAQSAILQFKLAGNLLSFSSNYLWDVQITDGLQIFQTNDDFQKSNFN